MIGRLIWNGTSDVLRATANHDKNTYPTVYRLYMCAMKPLTHWCGWYMPIHLDFWIKVQKPMISSPIVEGQWKIMVFNKPTQVCCAKSRVQYPGATLGGTGEPLPPVVKGTSQGMVRKIVTKTTRETLSCHRQRWPFPATARKSMIFKIGWIKTPSYMPI